jgi:hypothetical protein
MSAWMHAVTESPSNEEQFPKTRVEHQKIVAQMELILANEHFSQSKRSQLLPKLYKAK